MTVQVGQLFREEDDILSVVCMIRVNIASALSFLKDRKRRPKEVNGSLNFFFEIFDHCPKINPKRHTNKSYKKTQAAES
jgi:hypothetical protein